MARWFSSDREALRMDLKINRMDIGFFHSILSNPNSKDVRKVYDIFKNSLTTKFFVQFILDSLVLVLLLYLLRFFTVIITLNFKYLKGMSIRILSLQIKDL